jgi:LmbE family N-acetylglucosaminyl deacetylase
MDAVDGIGGGPGRRIVVVSPHLDDAALSLGAAIAGATRSGASVTVVTVFAGDEASSAPSSPWDRSCGFRTAGEASRRRKEEDRRACARLRARPVWLSFADHQYGHAREPAAVWSALAPHLEAAELVLLPGFPLRHRDHAWLTSLVLERSPPGMARAFYLELGYAYAPSRDGLVAPAGSGPAIEQPLRWTRMRARLADVHAKGRACRTYRSQFGVLRPHLPRRLALPEAFRTPEWLGLPEPA